MLDKLVNKQDLTLEEAKIVMREIMTGQCTDAQIGAFLIALKMKKETIEEIVGFVEVMREVSCQISSKEKNIVDTCGTGGDAKYTFNISTISAFVAAGAGVIVAKHGNRSVSSKCGSADILQALGVNLEISLKKIENCLKEVGICFLFAPIFHPAMKYAIGPRKELGIRTVFNILGPLTNPANANCQVLGVYTPELTEIMASVLSKLKSKHVLVIHGMDGLDEFTTTTKTKVTELKDNKISTYYLEPKNFHFKKTILEDLQVISIEENKKVFLDILSGKEKGHKRDIVLLNAGAVIYVEGKSQSISEGIKMAEKSIDTGSAYKKLQSLIKFSNQ